MDQGYTTMNPYREAPEAPIMSGMDLFGGYHLVPAKKGQSERGELLRYFSKRTGMSIPRLCDKLRHLGYQDGMKNPDRELKDFYYLKSLCDQEEGRTYVDKKTGQEKKLAWGQVFNQSLKVPA